MAVTNDLNSPVKILTRADDAGSLEGCNISIMQLAKAGFVKNVSVIAVGKFVEQLADWLSGDKSICFGMHATLNMGVSKSFKWKPLTGGNPKYGLVDIDGYMPLKPHSLIETKPSFENIFKEYNAQLDKLTSAGFKITYMDSHCFADNVIGITDEARAWAYKKGLLYHMDYTGYTCLTSREALVPEEGADNAAYITNEYSKLQGGNYYLILHPSLYAPDIIEVGGVDIARARSKEANAFSDADFIRFAERKGIITLRYDEAEIIL
ncbi:MAG: ChbG/HpnK family deacetylase [Defluviitaleaceae bacterium]|nr:ChbG/HpnK family deacetylase [Defluviitaleaceae bacterium]